MRITFGPVIYRLTSDGVVGQQQVVLGGPRTHAARRQAVRLGRLLEKGRPRWWRHKVSVKQATVSGIERQGRPEAPLAGPDPPAVVVEKNKRVLRRRRHVYPSVVSGLVNGCSLQKWRPANEMLVRRGCVSGPPKVTDIVSTASNRHIARIAHSALLEGVPTWNGVQGLGATHTSPP